MSDRPNDQSAIALGDHASSEFYADADGWWRPRCICGWDFGAPVPSAEDACDALMDHVQDVTVEEIRGASS